METIPRHKDFPRALGGRKPALPAEYLALREVRAPPLPARCPRRHRAGRACASHQRERLGSSASPASPPPLATQCVERGRSASHWTPGRQAAARRNFPRCASVVRWSCTLSAAGGKQRGRLVAVHAPEPLEERAWMPNGQLCAAQKLYTYYLPELERIKQRMVLERAPPSPPRHAPGAQPLTTSNLPEIANWGVQAAPSAPPLPPGEAFAGPPPGPGGPEFAGAAVGGDLDWDLLSAPAAPARQLRATASAPSAAAASAAPPVDDLLGRLQVAPCAGRAWRCCAPLDKVLWTLQELRSWRSGAGS